MGNEKENIETRNDKRSVKKRKRKKEIKGVTGLQKLLSQFCFVYRLLLEIEQRR